MKKICCFRNICR